MGLGGDLTAATVAQALPARAVRVYPALLSTEADALAWARAGAPAGAVVVADYQASPRGRGGLPWTVRPGRDLAFSVVLRPQLPPWRVGWLYTVAVAAVADVAGADAVIEWPDEVWRGGARVGAVGVHAEVGSGRTDWAVVSVHVLDVPPPRVALLARLVAGVEDRLQGESAEAVRAEHVARCVTLGCHVRARLVPVGPAGVQVVGRALDCRPDGGLVVQTASGRRVVVPPDDLGVLEPAEPPEPPSASP